MDKKQKKLLILSLIGILFLLFISHEIQPKTISIINITSNDTGKIFQIEGNIIKISSYNDNTFHVFTVKDSTGSIQAIFGSEDSISWNINQTSDYIITGKLEKYNNTLQINAEKIFLKS